MLIFILIILILIIIIFLVFLKFRCVKENISLSKYTDLYINARKSAQVVLKTTAIDKYNTFNANLATLQSNMTSYNTNLNIIYPLIVSNQTVINNLISSYNTILSNQNTLTTTFNTLITYNYNFNNGNIYIDPAQSVFKISILPVINQINTLYSNSLNSYNTINTSTTLNTISNINVSIGQLLYIKNIIISINSLLLTYNSNYTDLIAAANQLISIINSSDSSAVKNALGNIYITAKANVDNALSSKNLAISNLQQAISISKSSSTINSLTDIKNNLLNLIIFY